MCSVILSVLTVLAVLFYNSGWGPPQFSNTPPTRLLNSNSDLHSTPVRDVPDWLMPFGHQPMEDLFKQRWRLDSDQNFDGSLTPRDVEIIRHPNATSSDNSGINLQVFFPDKTGQLLPYVARNQQLLPDLRRFTRLPQTHPYSRNRHKRYRRMGNPGENANHKTTSDENSKHRSASDENSNQGTASDENAKHGTSSGDKAHHGPNSDENQGQVILYKDHPSDHNYSVEMHLLLLSLMGFFVSMAYRHLKQELCAKGNECWKIRSISPTYMTLDDREDELNKMARRIWCFELDDRRYDQTLDNKRDRLNALYRKQYDLHFARYPEANRATKVIPVRETHGDVTRPSRESPGVPTAPTTRHGFSASWYKINAIREAPRQLPLPEIRQRRRQKRLILI